MAPTPSSSKPIPLRDAKPFGVGGRRLCYVHPGDPGKCIKVLRQDEKRTVRITSKKRLPFTRYFQREYDNNAHEKQTLDRLARRIGTEISRHLPRSYGYVDTDMGRGLVLDLVRDHDGGISRSLRELISIGYELEQFRPAFDELREFFLRHTVLTRAVLDHNIAAQLRSDGTWRLVMIDGLGDPAWLPLAQWVRPLGQAKIRRRFEVAWPRLVRLTTNRVTREQIARSNWGQGFLNHRGENAATLPEAEGARAA
jgi:hypothetical protein